MAVKNVWKMLVDKKRGEAGKLSDYISFEDVDEYTAEFSTRRKKEMREYAQGVAKRA